MLPKPSRWSAVSTTTLLIFMLIVGGIALREHHSNPAVRTAQAEGKPTTATARPGTPVATSEAGCTSGIYGRAIEVTIYGSSCAEWDRIAAKSGDFWRQLSSPRQEPLVCSMSNRGPLIEVRDEGEAEYGSHICARLTSLGWSESPGPGVEEEHALEQQEARERINREQGEAREHAENARTAAAEARREAANQRHAEEEYERQARSEQLRADHEQAVAEAESG